MSDVTIVDYGSGNLLSVSRAVEHCGAEVRLASDPQTVESAQRLILPGVGAFADGMQGLRERGLVEAIRRFAATGRPLLGICLGMQMLATSSEEFGLHYGLDLVPGKVVPVPDKAANGQPQKIPHVGWAELLPMQQGTWAESILGRTPEGTSVYLVHSFSMVPTDPTHRLADCDYGGHRLCAAVRRGSIHGFQFHPEKSGPAGLAMLSEFLLY